MRRSLVMLALVAAWALVAAGCAGDEGEGDSAATPAAGAPGTTAAPATTASGGAAGGGNDGYGRDGYAGGGYGDRSQPAGGGASAGTGGGEVRIAGFAFAPGAITAKVGQRVTWSHQDPGATHTVTADQGQFRSGELAQGDEFAHVFRTAGSFAYHCAVHPDMRGTVQVGG